jgi:asparagine synthase (glutamine-hydrolysing)
MYDLENSLAEGLLTKADRGSMNSAVELRSPFLDEAVLRFAAGLPKSQRINGLQTKVFLKQYALRYLPESIVYRKKRGLSVPLSSWLQGPLHQWARSKLRHPLLEELGIDTHAAIELLNDHCRRKNDHARTIWTLAVLSEWLEWKAGGDNYE